MDLTTWRKSKRVTQRASYNVRVITASRAEEDAKEAPLLRRRRRAAAIPILDNEHSPARTLIDLRAIRSRVRNFAPR